MRHKEYPFYVVAKDSGLILAGNDFRSDANDTRADLPMPMARTCVLTHLGVMRKYKRIKWA
jgi:hypothetical protein